LALSIHMAEPLAARRNETALKPHSGHMDRPLTRLGWGPEGPMGAPLSPPGLRRAMSFRATSLAIVSVLNHFGTLSHTIAHYHNLMVAIANQSPVISDGVA
jgi:hypothetical protein